MILLRLIHLLQQDTGVTGMFQIDTGVAMPTGRTKYPFGDMLVGDSIRFAKENQANSARVSALRYVRTHAPGWQFQLRKVEDGWRLWRVA